MLGEIDLTLSPQKPEVFLCKPNGMTIAKINSRSGIGHTKYSKRNHLLTHTQKLKLGNINEMEFSIPYLVERNHELVQNPVIDLINDMYLLRVERSGQIEWYVITQIEDSMDESKDVKVITSYSLGYELKRKILPNFEVVGQNVTSIMNGGTTVDSNGNNTSFNGLLYGTSWSLGYVDTTFNTMYRSISVTSSKTVLDILLSDVGQSFTNILVNFDTVNRKINFYDITTYGVNRGLKISYGKYMKSVDSKYNADELVTRLYVYGQNGLSVNSVNPTGTEYLEDFSFFMNGYQEDTSGNPISHSPYMSDGLCHAILVYNKKINDNKTTYSGYLSQLSTLQSQLTSEQNTLNDLNTQLQTTQDQIDVGQASGTDVSSLQSQKAILQSQIATQQNTINSTQSQITQVNNNISTLQTSLAIENNFTSDQIKERDYYIVEKELRDNNYSDPQAMYDNAVIQFQKINTPQLVITTDILNFLECVTEQRNWNKLNLGDLVTIEYEKIGIDVLAQLVEIDFDHNEGNITLTISTVKDILRDKEKIINALNNALSTSTTVDMSKYKWNTVDQVSSDVNTILNQTWDASKRAIVAASNESVSINDRGITITNPNDANSFLRIAHGIIGISSDGGNTFKLAINGQGIFAQELIGQIIAGANLTITNSGGTFTVNETGVTIAGQNLTITNGLPDSQIASANSWNNATTTANNSVQQGVAYNGVVINTSNGIQVTTSNTLTQTTLNATNGIAIAKNTGTVSSPIWTNVFSADSSGNLYVKGTIDASDLRLNGTSILTSLSQIQGSVIASGINASNITTGSINANLITTGTLNASIVNVTNLNANNITTGTMSANKINGGTISGVTINVNTNATIGNDLFLNPSNYGAGICWGSSLSAIWQIYIDPAGGGMFLQNNNGGIYANNIRIDQPPVAVFG